MALIDLKSNLSFYGKNSKAIHEPNRDKTDTKFSDDGLGVPVTGYDDINNSFTSRHVQATDSFLIDDVTYSSRGLASRAAQLGDGSKFPIGPEGQIHGFDKVRLGFTLDSKYGDQYGVKFGDSGLADTYTANSPIDDVYDKLNLRDDAHNNSYIKQPYILRGIQRKGKGPQRWGLGDSVAGQISSTFDLPRAGILTSAERSAIDVVRIGKFLISPKGIGFLARQFGYQLMNPNTENKLGLSLGLPATQLYNPLSSPIQAIGNFVGVHAPRHGIPFITGGPLGGGGEYGTTKAVQRLANLLIGPKLGKQIQLYKEITEGDAITGTIPFKGGPYVTLSGPKGPKSILGIGGTFHNRSVDTSLDGQKGPSGALPSPLSALLDTLNRKGKLRASYNTSFTENFFRWNNETPYAPPEKFLINGPVMFTPVDGVEERTTEKEFEGGGRSSNTDNEVGTDYTLLPYDDIPIRPVGTIKINRTNSNLDKKDGKNIELTEGESNFKNRLRLLNEIDLHVDESLIPFQFGDIKFKAYLGTISDNFAPSWDSTSDHGRADPRYQYTGFERTLSFDFMVASEKKTKALEIWKKLQDLARLTHPVYGNEGFFGQFVNVTIGKLFTSKPMIITDLGFDWDNETPWEIDEDYQAPLYTNVNMTCTILGNRPQSNSKLYGIIGLT